MVKLALCNQCHIGTEFYTENGPCFRIMEVSSKKEPALASQKCVVCDSIAADIFNVKLELIESCHACDQTTYHEHIDTAKPKSALFPFGHLPGCECANEGEDDDEGDYEDEYDDYDEDDRDEAISEVIANIDIALDYIQVVYKKSKSKKLSLAIDELVNARESLLLMDDSMNSDMEDIEWEQLENFITEIASHIKTKGIVVAYSKNNVIPWPVCKNIAGSLDFGPSPDYRDAFLHKLKTLLYTNDSITIVLASLECEDNTDEFRGYFIHFIDDKVVYDKFPKSDLVQLEKFLLKTNRELMPNANKIVVCAN